MSGQILYSIDASQRETAVAALLSGLPPEVRAQVELGSVEAALEAALRALLGSPVDDSETAVALQAPGCERLRDFYQVGPAQRASVEQFADALVARVAAACRA